ncbi:ImmA/IrrE family metallo-endopeptidase [Halalkalibacterium ligniniphilum]|uniref:ImmA/IrrE family metallo-endopeptidase n=1 Tax=Halalkalibacterium ligniniphilum TaxID=1134413 RepID=UPI00034661F9|nr:ImmA/IrrE family metallo-endopeptidase [Halalkalibacterium ligniniphilum]
MRFANLREEKIAKKYKELGIQNPHDLTIENLSSLFKIKVNYYEYETDCLYNDKCAMMYINNQQSKEDIRKDFFHEMAHYFVHCGDQRDMPLEFERLQERQAHWTSLYLSMPRYIFEPIMNEVKSLIELREIFALPDSMIKERVRMIRQQNQTEMQYMRIKKSEESRINRSLNKGKVYKSTLAILNQLKNQVGEEKLSNDVKSLL